MDKVFGLMMVIGAMSFIVFGVCTNSIEAKESKVVGKIIIVMTAVSAIVTMVGVIGGSVFHIIK